MSKQNLHFKKAALLSALLLELSAGTSHAATIVVNETDCTLADAIESANTDTAINACTAGLNDDIIELPNNQEISLTAALPDIDSNITINGNDSTVSRGAKASNFSIINVNSNDFYNPVQLTLNDLSLVNGANSNTSINGGGGINMYTQGGKLNLNRCVVSGNTGGGIRVEKTNVYIEDSTISDNKGFSGATVGSAGIHFTGEINADQLNINRSTIANNVNYNTARTGGLYINNYYTFNITSVNITNSTISGNNTQSGGGGIEIYSRDFYYGGSNVDVTLSGVTLVGNTSAQNGGGIYNYVGEFYNNGADMTINNSIISGNLASTGNEIFSTDAYAVNLSGHNLIGLNGDSGTFGVTVDSNPSNQVIQQANLSAVIEEQLGDNGGFTPTHALVSGSPAIDFIPAVSCGGLTTDQTGNARPIDGDNDGIADCDAGSVELPDIIFKSGFE